VNTTTPVLELVETLPTSASSTGLELVEPLPTSASSTDLELVETLSTSAPKNLSQLGEKISKQAIRNSLKASTIYGIFGTVFSNITGGVLLTNFLLKLDATPLEIGLLSSIPLLVNFLQPLGGYIADNLKSRHWYTLGIYGISRMVWLLLVAGMWFWWSEKNPHQLVTWTLGTMLVSNTLAALGGCAWFSWMAALVPHRLRGRYFGLRNSATSLTNLVCTPLLGFAISTLPGDTIHNYGVLLLFAIAAGIISLACQFWIKDVNPQTVLSAVPSPQKAQKASSEPEKLSIFKNTNFLKFLLYIGLWTFAANLSFPFFNFYMLHNLALDLRTVTVYSSLLAGANIVLVMFWGKLADKIGNRPLLLLIGTLLALSPLFWLFVDADTISVYILIPLIHIVIGGFGAGFDLCNNNIQMSVAPKVRPTQYYAMAAAVIGLGGGLGSTVGGLLAQIDIIGGLPGLFALSAVVRFIALIPLVFVQEPRSQGVIELVRKKLPRFKFRGALVSPVGIAIGAK
jgi:MFS family permease